MKKIILSGHIEVSSADLDRVRKALPHHVELTLSEPGCLVFEVTENLEQEGRFDVYEEFESKAAFEVHQKRVSESDWGRITKNVRRVYVVEELDD